ncbi:hypothetical protein KAX97_11230, partial [candidate division WOR-3 bacterium]|nr:hypothetical protein [candidate division WOR-3 bacterium]
NKEIRHQYYVRHREQILKKIELRTDIIDELEFQFVDSGYNDMDRYVLFLRKEGIPERHIGWFEKDVQKFMVGV